MCADRIEYNIHTGIITNQITKDEAKNIVDHLKFEDGKWYFDNQDSAQKFARIPLYFTKNLWGAPHNIALYHYFSLTLKRALTLRLINEKDLHFGQDQEIISILEKSDDFKINQLMTICKNLTEHFIVTDTNYDIYTKPKFRGIDPLVKIDGKTSRLSEIDANFKREYLETKEWCAKGYGMKLLIKSPSLI
jgi:hypothetical protein